jgi:Spy/CpxP family protein refolding chaperone
MFRKTTLFAAGLLLLAALPVAAHGFGGPGGPGGPGAGGPPPIIVLLRSANLSSDQQNQIHTIMHTSHQQIGPLFEQLHSIDEQISAKLLGTASVTATDFSALEQQKSQIQQQIDENFINTAIQVRGVLSPAQLATAASTNQQIQSLHQQIEKLLNPNGDTPPPPPGD